MGSQPSDDSSTTYTADMVAAAFVERYYHVLHAAPQHAHHFYQDNSILGRPGADGTMTSVTTMQGIGDKIMSLDYKDSLATIVTVYAQGSIMGGVIVGVTGFLTGKDNVKRNFTQTFFLAQQEKGYFVLNDFLHFMDPHNPPAPLPVPSVEENTSAAPLTQEKETAHVVNLPVRNDTSSVVVVEASVKVSGQTETKNSSVEELTVSDQSEIKNSSVEQVAVSHQSEIKNSSVEQVAVSEVSGNKSQKTTDLASNVQDVQKTSYASILAKEKIVTAPVAIVRVAANTNQQPPASAPPQPLQKPPASAPLQPHQKPPASAPPQPHQQPPASAPPKYQQPPASAPPSANQQAPVPPRASAPPSEGAHQNSNGQAQATGIYIGGLPMDITYPRLKAVVVKFGPVKQDGIQIRRYEDGFTFGFVEFESSKSAQNAFEAHTIAFGNKEAYIDFKRSNMQGGSNRGRSPSGGGRGGYGNGNFRNMERSNGEDGPNGNGYVNRGGYSSGEAARPPRRYSTGQAPPHPPRGFFGGSNGEGNRRAFYQNGGGGRAPRHGG